MENERFLIKVSGVFGNINFVMGSCDSSEIRCVKHSFNDSFLFGNILPQSLFIYELINGRYELVQEIGFILMKEKNCYCIEDIVKAAVWHYEQDKFYVLDDDFIQNYIDEYRDSATNYFAG